MSNAPSSSSADNAPASPPVTPAIPAVPGPETTQAAAPAAAPAPEPEQAAPQAPEAPVAPAESLRHEAREESGRIRSLLLGSGSIRTEIATAGVSAMGVLGLPFVPFRALGRLVGGNPRGAWKEVTDKVANIKNLAASFAHTVALAGVRGAEATAAGAKMPLDAARAAGKKVQEGAAGMGRAAGSAVTAPFRLPGALIDTSLSLGNTLQRGFDRVVAAMARWDTAIEAPFRSVDTPAAPAGGPDKSPEPAASIVTPVPAAA